MIKKRNLLRLFIVIILVLMSIGFYPVKVNFLKNHIASFLNKKNSTSIRIGEVRIALFKGLIINDVSLELFADRGNTLGFEIPVVFINYRLGHFYFNSKEVLKEIKSFLSLNQAYAPDSLLVFLEESSTAAVLENIRLGRCNINGLVNEKTVNIKNVDIRIDFTHRGKKEFIVSLKADSLLSDDNAADGVYLKTVLKDGELHVEELRVGVYRGVLDARCVWDLKNKKIKEGNISIKGVDIGTYYASGRQRPGTVEGRINSYLIFRPSELSLKSVRLDGRIEIEKAHLFAIPLFHHPVITRAFPSLNSMEINKLTGDISVAGGRVLSDNLTGEGDPMCLSLCGWTDLVTGGFNYNVKGVFKSGYKKHVKPLVWNTLIPDDNNDGRILYSTVSGTFYQPVVMINKEHGGRAVRSVFKEVKNGIRSIFR